MLTAIFPNTISIHLHRDRLTKDSKVSSHRAIKSIALCKARFKKMFELNRNSADHRDALVGAGTFLNIYNDVMKWK